MAATATVVATVGATVTGDARPDSCRNASTRTRITGTSLLSLAGIPLTAGFVAKLTVLYGGIEVGLWALVAVLVAASAIGIHYTLRVVVTLLALPPALAPAAGQPAASPPARRWARRALVHAMQSRARA